jgi:hypothetical protein
MHYFRLPGMTRRQAISLWWYNNVKRHWRNFVWRHGSVRRQWMAEGRDPRYFPQAGAFNKESWAWALEQGKKIEAEIDMESAVNSSCRGEYKTYDEFKRC